MIDDFLAELQHHEYDPRREIAMQAAKWIAEEGMEYGEAKKKATKLVLGNKKAQQHLLPSHEEIENEVRAYYATFHPDTQPHILRKLRETALEIMRDLSSFHPYLIGSVLNGSAGEHSDIYLQLFPENSKEVVFFLLNQNIDYELSKIDQHNQEDVEVYSFFYRHIGVHLQIYTQQARHLPKERASIEDLAQLLQEQKTNE